MAEISVRINEQTYSLACDDGEEARVEALAAYLESHIQRFAKDVGRVAESRLLMLAALNICDELFTAREQLSARGEVDLSQTRARAEALADKAQAVLAK